MVLPFIKPYWLTCMSHWMTDWSLSDCLQWVIEEEDGSEVINSIWIWLFGIESYVRGIDATEIQGGAVKIIKQPKNSCLVIPQHFFMKYPLEPSGPRHCYWANFLSLEQFHQDWIHHQYHLSSGIEGENSSCRICPKTLWLQTCFWKPLGGYQLSDHA